MLHELQAMYAALSMADRRQLRVLLLSAGAFTLLDFISTAVLMPFLTFLIAPDKLEGTFFFNLLSGFGSMGRGTSLLTYGAIIIGLQATRLLGSIWITYNLNSFSYERFKEVACAAFTRFLGYSYEEYAAINPAVLWRLLSQDGMQYGNICYYIMQIIIDVGAFACIYGLLLWVSFKLTLALTVMAGLLGVLMKPLNRLVSAAGSLLANSWEECYRVVNETHGNFKILRLVGGESQASRRFEQAATGVKKSVVSQMTLQTTPRVAFEVVIIVLFVMVAGCISHFFQAIDIASPLFSMYAIALNKFVPAINRILYHYQQLNYSLGAVKKGMNELLRYTTTKPIDQEPTSIPAISFTKNISCNDLTFTFAGQTRPIFQNLSLHINQGERIAIVGKSGAGKSTLIDLLIGLQRPTVGSIGIDGTPLIAETHPCWWRMIGYIPQQTYLIEGTVRENVVLGRPYNETELIACLEKAKALEFLKAKDGLDTQIGEGGFQMSGGQKQRIALARALYGNPALLILDEGTAALDQETEDQVLQEILRLTRDTTILMVTHRPAILDQCDRVLLVQDGMISERYGAPSSQLQTIPIKDFL